MSNLVKGVMATKTTERVSLRENTSKLFQDVFSQREDLSHGFDPNHLEVATKYRIGITLGTTAIIPDYLKEQDSRSLPESIIRAKQQIIEAVFGEFRADFRRIEGMLYSYDFEGAAAALLEMEEKMFKE